MDDGGTIPVAEGNDALSEPCAVVSKDLTLRGERYQPEITGTVPVPPLEDIARVPQFEPTKIDATDFEAEWRQRAE